MYISRYICQVFLSTIGIYSERASITLEATVVSFLTKENKIGRRKRVTKAMAWRKYDDSKGLNLSGTIVTQQPAAGLSCSRTMWVKEDKGLCPVQGKG